MNDVKEKPIKLAVHYCEEMSLTVFTTNYKDVYEELMKHCTSSNVSENPIELNGFHAQCWQDH